jgi:ribosomal protein S12 methylthiotransferase
LMSIQQKISARKLRRFRGRSVTALVEGPSKDTPLVWEARLEGMAPEIDGKLYLNDIEVPGTTISARTGDVVTAEISETHEYDMVGRVVEILDVPRPAAAQAAVNAPVQRVLTGAALRIL